MALPVKACGPYKPHEKGRVENGVGYVKKNFLAGLQLSSLDALNAAARQWLDQVANVRVHGETHQKPQDLFDLEKPKLRPLTVLPYDLATVSTVSVSRRCRVTLDTNHYSVPPRYASTNLTLKAYPDRLCLYHQDQLVAEHAAQLRAASGLRKARARRRNSWPNAGRPGPSNC